MYDLKDKARRIAHNYLMRVLIVEDDPLIGSGLQAGLRQAGYASDWVRDGTAAQLAVEANPYHLIVLDLGLPKIDGLDVLRQWRAGGLTTPVIALTARHAVPDRIAGLNAGADDYLAKPFDLNELIARIAALLRRSHGRASGVIRHGDMEVDPAAHSVQLAGVTIALSAREFALLMDLLDHRGMVRSRTQLEESIYGWNEEIDSNAIEFHIHHLRKKLGAKLIQTVRGVGYLIPRDTTPA